IITYLGDMRMALESKISEELKKATLAGDKLRMETLRSIRAAIIEFNKSGIDRDMNEEDELKILKNQAKRRKDAIEMYDKGGRQDLADKEKAELIVIQEFLPAQMSEDEVKAVCTSIIKELGITEMKDFGKAMGTAMKELKGKADGALVQSTIKSLLGAE
ncbi:GatB/YqeY domain-containing protein, partial [Bacteroidota bacterium]